MFQSGLNVQVDRQEMVVRAGRRVFPGPIFGMRRRAIRAVGTGMDILRWLLFLFHYNDDHRFRWFSAK